ncbi:cysteine--tRNA ligase [Streptomyces lunaelactis]|uniref:cysteine--tRNA ligase n=1 Tax=Streptomyces lunaelactis TaxID=1535768 RepID=UPI001585325E|nr:cysteine--tRNA ligase [Streptomyces lunaelactis]NUK04251.1 cysteine--tRNA ligase [Streptomyces lunaelactis]NUK08296.1 cysteine--tRNA ligase [Streptomyces lunaelactis]NUK18678.1 cysteine--tRNA ligase [Streptomyces lunaelactis]NUK24997.1 cysteine--tRNA ligase [Streptomyces lunaelactis]NUK37512.1 cysteine--tRNA ligase [Streptomyces lunaelactis]
MTIRLYDTSARQIRDFTPIVPGCVSIYLCGATVQAAPHIGHIRSGLNFDIMRRWFEYRGYDVTFIRNVTDIDDKIIWKSAEQNRPWWSIGYENERAFNDGYDALGCLPATYEPRATGHITEMVEMMRGLIERGHAYEADGNVYFDVRSFPGYLELSNQDLDDLRQPSGEGETGKRDARDFAMWKAAKPGEPSWETPWGRGRPGWHLECSAMAHKYLGEAFDIHGGGLDLIFPHHENEIAQAKAFGDAFANFWVHNHWVTLSGEKMSKSLGNSVLVSEMVKQWRPIVLRYYLGTPHYRSTIEYSEEALREAESAFARIEGFVQRVIEKAGGVVEPASEVPLAFAEAMDDDLGVPQALAIVHTTVRQGNSALAADDKDAAVARLAEVRAMLGVLGLDPLDERWAGEGERSEDLHGVVDTLVRLVLQQREAARGRKDWATADAIRDQLLQSGLVIEDGPDGPRWTLGPR